tara:strand:+ start:68 stop:1051 length:984 start_codon:yes stop_codon:yes gene_type:complete
MELKKIQFSDSISEQDIYSVFIENYSSSITDFFQFELDWMYNAYNVFKDYDKFIILIYIIEKTFSTYKDFYFRKSYDEFYAADSFELKKFSIIDVSKDLLISKETARRKIIELEKSGIIKKDKKKVVITKYGLEIQRPTGSIRSFTKLLSRFSVLLKSENLINKEITPNEFEILIKNNFTQFWHYFYEFQIPYLLKWKRYFGELDKWIVAGSLAYNQNLFFRNNRKEKIDNISFTKNMIEQITHLKNMQGLNAMTISDLSGIPRPTVLRKLKSLMKSKHIIKDKKNLYSLSTNEAVIKELENMRIATMQKFSTLLNKYYNVVIQSRS